MALRNKEIQEMSNEKQQTAVEWLIDKLTDTQFLWLSEKPEMNDLIKIIEQAKEMEKEQIRKAYCQGEHYKDTKLTTDYYNETYGGN